MQNIQPQTYPLVSLIIITYHSAHCLHTLFASLRTILYSNYELLVVDNASSDGTLQLIPELAPQARLLANSENLGFGRACNRGAAAAQGDFLVFMNPDIQVTPEWLHKLLECAAAAPDAALISPETLPIQALNAPAPQNHSYTSKYDVSAALPGCALMMRREAWEQLGGFDERIFLYWEDTELCWRAWILGWRVIVAHEAFIYHERGGSGGGAHWAAEANTNRLYTYLKLMRWRRILPELGLLLLKTLRYPHLYRAWLRNIYGLGLTMAQRRSILSRRRVDPAYLEHLIDLHTAKNRV